MAKSRFESDRGPTQRQLRVGELIRRALSEVLARGDLHDPELDGVSITVGEVRTSPDLKIATVFILPLGGGNAQSIIKALARSKYELRRAINKSVKLKFSPDLRFLIDETFDQMDETRVLLSNERVRQDIEATDADDVDPA